MSQEPKGHSQNPRFRRLWPAVAVGACAAAGIVLGLRPAPEWWLGAGLLSAAAMAGWQLWRDRLTPVSSALQRTRRIAGRSFVPAHALRETLCVGVVLAIATVMVWDMVGGGRPVSHDHTVHFYKAWQLQTHLLPEGRLFGWSHRWFAGYPVNYLYPIGADLWVLAFHYLSFGLLNLSSAYAFAIWAMHALSGYAAYRVGRMVGGSWVGLLAALFLLTDSADFRLGGWKYTMDYGVWPQALSVAFGLLAVTHVRELLEGRRMRPIAWFGSWMGLALLTHPIQLLFAPLLFVAAVLAAGFAAAGGAAARVMRLCLGYTVAVLIACIWLLPFLATREYTSAMGLWWQSTHELGRGLVDLDALPGTLPYVIAFGIVGLVIMLRSKGVTQMFVGFTALLVPFVSSSSFIDEFHLPAVSDSFLRVQFIRMSTMVKPFWFVASACGLLWAGKWAWNRARDMAAARPTVGRDPLRAGMLGLVIGLLTLPFVLQSVHTLWTRHVDRTLVVQAEREGLEDRRQMLAWLEYELPDDGFYRVGIFTGHDHDLFDLATQLDKPIYKRGFTPCSNFVYKMRGASTETLEMVGLRYAISKHPLSDTQFEHLARFGTLHVSRFRYYRPQPFHIEDGSGDVELVRFEDEEIVLEAAPGSHGRLWLHVSHFPRWRAYRDGKPIHIEPQSAHNEPERTGFMTVPLEPGTYRFEFRRATIDYAGIPLTLLGLLLVTMFWLLDRQARIVAPLRRALDRGTRGLERLSEPRFRTARRVALVVVVAGSLLTALAMARWRPPLHDEELGGTPPSRVVYDFLERLGEAQVWLRFPLQDRPCRRYGEHFVCPTEEGKLDVDQYVASYPTTIEEYRMVRCIRARPQPKGRLLIHYDDVPVGDALVGYFGIERSGRMVGAIRPVDFAVHFDDRIVYEEPNQRDSRMYWFRIPARGSGQTNDRDVDVTFEIKARNVYRRHFCYYAQMVEY